MPRSRYSVHPGVAMAQKWVAELKVKTGRSVEEWVPATRTRIDLGLALGKEQARIPKRSINTGGGEKGDRMTHRIEIVKVGDVDDDARRWLKRAYDLDAG